MVDWVKNMFGMGGKEGFSKAIASILESFKLLDFKQYLMELIGKLASCLILVNLSS